MFDRLRIWILGSSGLREATRDAAREATAAGLHEGFHLGVSDFLDRISGPQPVDIEATATKAIENGNSQNGHEEPKPKRRTKKATANG